MNTSVISRGLGLLVLVSACGPFGEPVNVSGGGLVSPEVVAACPASYKIDDCEDMNNQIMTVEGRGGYWYTYADKSSSVDPEPGGQFAMTAGGATGSKEGAARIKGSVGTAEPFFVGMGFSLTDPKSPYDASMYDGVSFWAKGSGKVNFKIPSTDTDGDYPKHRCNECFNDFSKMLALTGDWKQYIIPFSKLKQDPNWGSRFGRLRVKEITGMQWQVLDKGAPYEVWVDDVRFYSAKCGTKDAPQGDDKDEKDDSK
jgi:hypothetical protein